MGRGPKKGVKKEMGAKARGQDGWGKGRVRTETLRETEGDGGSWKY